ncbi:unnamed protein product [marine sediment metagenome]|uniref:Uncharacterized protein n=1 Tax=marine sediment metagenome TaxID=412755 RepID=X1HKB6_9ZZZZ
MVKFRHYMGGNAHFLANTEKLGKMLPKAKGQGKYNMVNYMIVQKF